MDKVILLRRLQRIEGDIEDFSTSENIYVCGLADLQTLIKELEEENRWAQ